MSIIITEKHKQTAEVEFAGHPDVFSSTLAANIVKKLAEEMNNLEMIDKFRADLNIQTLATNYKENEITPIVINVGGQLVVSDKIDILQISQQTALELLEKIGYFKNNDFSPQKVQAVIEGITIQSPVLNKTTNENKFADSCVVYGHYIASPFGINGTYPSLIISQKINNHVNSLIEKIPGLCPDGKVHVSIQYTQDGFMVDDIYLSISHQKNISDNFKDSVRNELTKILPQYNLENTEFEVNAGGDFNIYFLQADAGVSKAKDDVIITGGLHQLGTDRVWGKCLYKASSTLIPYAFALSKVVCDITGAKYASVSGRSKYGQQDAKLQLQDIDPGFENLRQKINTALQKMPLDRDNIRETLNLGINLESYQMFNDVEGFHSQDKEWKKDDTKLHNLFKAELK